MRRSVSRFVASSNGGSQSNRSAIRHSQRLRDVLPASFILALPGLAGAQTTTLSGTVTDNQGGVLPGVTVTETSTGRQHVCVTDENGQYRFPPRGRPAQGNPETTSVAR